MTPEEITAFNRMCHENIRPNADYQGTSIADKINGLLERRKMTPEERAEQVCREIGASAVTLTEGGGSETMAKTFEIAPFIASAIRQAILEEREACAMVVEGKEQFILQKQATNADPGSFDDSVNLNLRMTAVILPDIAAAIRART